MALGTRRNPRAPTPVPETPVPPVDSPARTPSIDLSDLAGMAENTSPGFPRLGNVIHPSDDADDEGHALLSPVQLSRGRVRERSGGSLGSPAPPAPKKSKGKQRAIHPEFHGFPPASPSPSASALPSPAPSGFTLRIPGGRSPGRMSSLPPPVSYADEVRASFSRLTAGLDLLDPSVRARVHLAFRDHAAVIDVEALLPELPPTITPSAARGFPPLPTVLPGKCLPFPLHLWMRIRLCLHFLGLLALGALPYLFLCGFPPTFCVGLFHCLPFGVFPTLSEFPRPLGSLLLVS